MSDYKNYTSSLLTFYDDKIVVEDSGSSYNGIEVMMSWEDPIMSASAAYVTQNGGDIARILGYSISGSAGDGKDIIYFKPDTSWVVLS